MKTLKPLPDIDTLKAAYYRTGSVKKAARSLHIAQWRMSSALFDAGITSMRGCYPERKPRKGDALTESACPNCANATAVRCPFMRATKGRAGAVLDRMGATYKTKPYRYSGGGGIVYEVTLYTVLSCPHHSAGELDLWNRVSPAGGGELAVLRYPHGVGRL